MLLVVRLLRRRGDSAAVGELLADCDRVCDCIFYPHSVFNRVWHTHSVCNRICHPV